MDEQARRAKPRGRYRLRARADGMVRTRQRITAAAVELHGSIGPAATTMSAVAERAGVTRATLYRHFPDEATLFAACSREWLAAHPRPDVAAWSAIVEPRRRLQLALHEMYAYYATTEGMLANLLRDSAALPEPITRNLASYPDQMLEVLDVGWPEGGDRRVRRAAITHAVAFETWRSLTRAGLSDREAAELMAGLVVGCGLQADVSAVAGQ
jgi:AcrR family transcriptional regulator